MILLGFRRKLTALALCKSIESAIQWFRIHHRITFATIRNPAVYLSGARVSIFSTLVPRLVGIRKKIPNKGQKQGLIQDFWKGGVWVRFADFISFFSEICHETKTKLFHFHRILKIGAGRGGGIERTS